MEKCPAGKQTEYVLSNEKCPSLLEMPYIYRKCPISTQKCPISTGNRYGHKHKKERIYLGKFPYYSCSFTFYWKCPIPTENALYLQEMPYIYIEMPISNGNRYGHKHKKERISLGKFIFFTCGYYDPTGIRFLWD